MIVVSAHALVRHHERGGGDVCDTAAWIADRLERAHGAAERLGVRNYGVRLDDLFYIVRDGTVTTVLPDLAVHSRFTALAPRAE